MLGDVIRRLGELGYEVGGDDEAHIVFCTARVESALRNALNRRDIPEGLNSVFIDRVCGEFLFDKMCSGELPEGAFFGYDSVKSVREGDVSVEFAEPRSSERFINRLRGAGAGELARFRRIGW